MKETIMYYVSEDVSRAGFGHLVEELRVHLGGIEGWSRILSLFKENRTERVALTGELLNEIVGRTQDEDDDFNQYEIDTNPGDKGLRAYFPRRPNEKLKSTVSGTKSGFQVFWHTIQEEHPITESTEDGFRWRQNDIVESDGLQILSAVTRPAKTY